MRSRRSDAPKLARDRPFPSSLGLLYQNEVRCSAFDMEMIIHAHANKTHFHKKDFALGLILKVRVLGTRKWPICFHYWYQYLVPSFLGSNYPPRVAIVICG